MSKIKEIINNRKFVVVVIALLMMVTLITGTYAWFTWSNNSSENTSLTMTIGRLADVTFTSGNDINTGLTPVFNFYDGESTTFAINNMDTSGTPIKYVVKLNVTSLPVISDDNESIEALKSLKYVLLKGEKVVAKNSLSGVSNGDSIDIYTGSMSTSGTQEFTFYIYIDGNMENPSSMMNTTFVGELMVEAEEGELFVDYLTNLYMSASPAQATVANNGINYYYAESVGMMNDGMGSNHTWEDGSNAGNIRYYGATPSNYIDIGDRDSEGNVIPWRIIGVFKNMKLADGSTDTLVKVIRDDSIGDMAWDDVSNDWNNAELQTYLNEGEYYTGLPQAVKDKIVKVQWNLGGYGDSKIYSNDIYGYERGELKADDSFQTVWEGNIALMYPSDYGYAADLTKCSQTLYNYNTDTTNCTGTDWLFNSKRQWLLTPSSSYFNRAWGVDSAGSVSRSASVLSSVGVRAVLYLNSELVRETGDGATIESAYVVR